MEGGGFGRNAGPRGDYRGPLPDFGSAARAQGNHGRSRKPSPRRDAILGNGSQAHPTHKRSGAWNVWKRTLPAHDSQTERSHEASEMNYQSLSKKSRSRSPRSDVNFNTGRKQVAYDDLILDDTGVEPSRGNQLSNGNPFQSPMVQLQVGNQLSERNQIQRSVLPQTSHQKEAAARKRGKHSDHRSVPSCLHGAVKSAAPSPDIITERDEEAKARRLARFGAEVCQSSPQKEAAARKRGKHSDHRSVPSCLHAAVKSAAPSPDIITERDEEAKARRLARFGAEVSQPVVEMVEPPVSNADSSKQQADVNVSDSTAIVGLCPDMCPEPERCERQRKGTLDKYERVNGDRNITTKFLAVKKYDRTADRDPAIIRPLPVLLKSMDYLLGLLNKPYGDELLDLYNFLWDRMRAIRMDLRMQHICNQEAISMLEQMIRLHIIAMHELCEYKGEGFSEGFDAHLNIEQMSKASLELFQMYEDHNRKGISICTEREFRGYYALLKIDKHPDYKVEPADLSLDLAKMPAEVRHSAEIRFARDVAKACRTGNYHSFFRLAKKATYLQACLMHAHFSKLRTEALASLHMSFPSNQGMPLAHLKNVLAMEGENIETFVERHGLVLKCFEEMYFLKNGPFVRPDGDLRKHSPLVAGKRSLKINLDVRSSPDLNTASIEDVSFYQKVVGLERFPPEKPDTEISDSAKLVEVSALAPLEFQPGNGSQETEVPERHIDLPVISEKPMDVAVISKRPIDLPVIPEMPTDVLVIPDRPIDVPVIPEMPIDVSVTLDRPIDLPVIPEMPIDVPVTLDRPIDVPVIPEMPIDVPVTPDRPIDVPVIPPCHLPSSPVMPASNITSNLSPSVHASPSTMDDEMEMYLVEKSQENMKVSRDKMKLIFRKWRQRTTEIRLEREKKERKKALVHEALESLPVGPLLRTSVYTAPRKEKLNIDRAIQARLRKQEKSWSVLNTSELVSPIVALQNPNARCLCWKLLLSLPADLMDMLPRKWLLTKFNLHEEGSISISKTWCDPQLSLCFVRAEKTGPFEKKSVTGASSILFLLSGGVPLEVHKARLHNLCSRIPTNSNLPLLIAVGDHLNGEEETAVIAKLGLGDIEQTKLRGISVTYLNLNPQNELHSNGFLDDGRLREGVRWLAEHSPPQSEVSLVDTRAILLMYLKLKLEVLGDACEVGPDQCIAAINESIDWLIRAILGSALANPNCWPCPEIDLLEKSSSERHYAEMTLPRASWSEPQKVRAQTDVLIGCMLPCFGFDCSWLSEGSYYRDKKRVQDQKQGLEKYLFNYLKLYTGSHEAMDQARNLVQKCTSLVLRDSTYYLVPKWTAIFRRIFNQRLIGIPKDASDVYVSKEIANVDFFNVGWKDLLVSEELALVPLDEMIERCFISSSYCCTC